MKSQPKKLYIETKDSYPFSVQGYRAQRFLTSVYYDLAEVCMLGKKSEARIGIENARMSKSDGNLFLVLGSPEHQEIRAQFFAADTIHAEIGNPRRGVYSLTIECLKDGESDKDFYFEYKVIRNDFYAIKTEVRIYP